MTNKQELSGQEAIARIVDPYAWSNPNGMAETERVLFNYAQPHRQQLARDKAKDIIALSTAKT